jgi:hypothetical protein
MCLGSALKKYTVLPSTRGGRLDVLSERTRLAAMFIVDFKSKDGTILLEVMHRPKKRKQLVQAHGILDINPKV